MTPSVSPSLRGVLSASVPPTGTQPGDSHGVTPAPPTPTGNQTGDPSVPLTPPTPPKTNPFDPAKFRLSADYGATLGVKKVINVVPCRKPNRQEWVRVRSGEEWRLETAIFEDKASHEFYLVDPAIVSELVGEVVPVCLFVAVNRHGDPFFWQAKLPSTDGRSNSWNDSALMAAQLAETKWIRIAANMEGGFYDTYEATAPLPDPSWPELTFGQLLEICFHDRLIKTPDHIVIRRLRGEV